MQIPSKYPPHRVLYMLHAMGGIFGYLCAIQMSLLINHIPDIQLISEMGHAQGHAQMLSVFQHLDHLLN